jgi:hypothetical protein
MSNSGKFIDALIDEIREESENENFTTEVGITEEEIIRYVNDASYRLHEKIIQQHPDVFIGEEIQNVVSGTASYSIKATAFLNNRISQVEYSYNGSVNNYVVLDPVSIRQREQGITGTPQNYIRQSDRIILSPSPTDSNATIRISYTQRPKRIDKRRGIVKAVTLDSTTSTITNLEVNYVNGTAVDNAELIKYNLFSVVDKYGELQMDAIKLSSIDSSTSYDATLTDDSTFTYATGETITVGDYVCSGSYASTHFQLPESVERYVRAYAIWKVLKRDSSVDSAEAIQELSEMERGIIASYAELSDDIRTVPEINKNGEWL